MYGPQIAKQYKAYRPPLHQVILKECFESNQQFSKALDIGCGVGHSAVALLPYCKTIVGIDASQAMLDEAHAHHKISYELHGELPSRWDDREFDLITFAGSLFYCKSPALIQDCLRIMNDTGIIVVYDFTVNLNPVLIGLGLQPQESDYDPTINLDDVLDLQVQYENKQKHTFTISRADLVHILFTDTNIRAQLSLQTSAEGTDVISNLLTERMPTDSIICEADLYCRRYQIRA